jgi:hypothetical protein
VFECDAEEIWEQEDCPEGVWEIAGNAREEEESMTDLSKVLTCELFEELKKREGVMPIDIPDPGWYYKLEFGNTEDRSHAIVEDTGPATILVVID